MVSSRLIVNHSRADSSTDFEILNEPADVKTDDSIVTGLASQRDRPWQHNDLGKGQAVQIKPIYIAISQDIKVRQERSVYLKYTISPEASRSLVETMPLYCCPEELAALEALKI